MRFKSLAMCEAHAAWTLSARVAGIDLWILPWGRIKEEYKR
jgi:hypothetical protein